jgi:uncharacterized BrkB/YihY/UPF0761 family membrane protein
MELEVELAVIRTAMVAITIMILALIIYWLVPEQSSQEKRSTAITIIGTIFLIIVAWIFPYCGQLF